MLAKWRTPDAQDLYGVFHFSLAGLPSIRDYHNTLAALTPVVRSDPWVNASTGFYLSADRDCFLRLLYFTRDSKRSAEVVGTWLEAGLMQPKQPEPPARVQVAKAYGGQEARFRAYLCTCTQVGLDLLEQDQLRARRLFASYRLQAQLQGEPARSHFEPTFIELSETYAQFPQPDRKRLWVDFTSGWGWEHMFVNMILAVDWDYRARPRPPFSDEDVDEALRQQWLGL